VGYPLFQRHAHPLSKSPLPTFPYTQNVDCSGPAPAHRLPTPIYPSKTKLSPLSQLHACLVPGRPTPPHSPSRRLSFCSVPLLGPVSVILNVWLRAASVFPVECSIAAGWPTRRIRRPGLVVVRLYDTFHITERKVRREGRNLGETPGGLWTALPRKSQAPHLERPPAETVGVWRIKNRGSDF